MRRCLIESSRSLRGLTVSTPPSKRRCFSSKPKPIVNPSSNAKLPPQSGPEPGTSHSTKVIFGGVLIGAAVTAAYKTGYLDRYFDQQDSQALLRGEKLAHSHSPNPNSVDLGDIIKVAEKPNIEAAVLDSAPSQEKKHLPAAAIVASDDPSQDNEQAPTGFTTEQQSEVVSEQLNEAVSEPQNEVVSEQLNEAVSKPKNEAVSHASTPQQTLVISTQTQTERKPTTSDHFTPPGDIPQASLTNGAKPSNSLLNEYFLMEKDGRSNATSFKVDAAHGSVSHPKEKEHPARMDEELKDAYITNDGKLVLDFLQAIHAAEKSQAELDARILAEEKTKLREKYEKELKDARARELMYAEEAAILDKELTKERTKLVATVKSLQEKAAENLMKELEQKDNEVELLLKKAQELAKAELAAAIAREKASQIEKMAEANLNINALCLAFYARSEEVRQSHSVHKLALGSLALEDSLSRGLPIKTEINELHNYLEGTDDDSLLDLVFSSLPEETLNNGTDTQLELNQKFDGLKGTLRHFSLIPPGGGGILAHSLARIASWIKLREDDVSGDGIESIINRVERFLSEGKLAEAADALEGGVNGSQAEEIIRDWVKQARNRAIAEQALSLLQSYAISVSGT